MAAVYGGTKIAYKCKRAAEKKELVTINNLQRLQIRVPVPASPPGTPRARARSASLTIV
jgi:hypothetical protein